MKVCCPTCFYKMALNPLYVRERCPVLNNIVYDFPEQARNCSTGRISLVQCSNCGLVFNNDFDEELVVYDNFYDGSRSHSSSYHNYIDSLSGLCSSWLNRDTTVLEIGCGKGDFLKKLSDLTGCRAVGYDTSYDCEESYNSRVLFHKNYFDPKKDDKKYDMLILRHVLEHVAKPFDFLRCFCTHRHLKNNARLLIEVPSFDWIIKKHTFYDITYEHCNYFFLETLSDLMAQMGFTIENAINVFDGQYLLMQGIYKGDKAWFESNQSFPALEEISGDFQATKLKLVENIKQADDVCVWGASGKGVIFLSDLPDEILNKVSYVIDINPSKQGKFLPVSGKRVDSPDVLKQVKGKPLVLIMNEVYEQEIRANLDKNGIEAFLIPAVMKWHTDYEDEKVFYQG